MKQNKGTKDGFSTVLIVVIVVVILGIVALVAIKGLNLIPKPASSPAAQVEKDQVVKALSTQSNSDEVGPIEQDISGTNLDNLDTELNQVDKDLNSL